ncbi:MAG: TIGR01906 family membrane protein [Pelolinea sp.]|nr:TIGR01906 family membrane protein [Pelolinea sp.]
MNKFIKISLLLITFLTPFLIITSAMRIALSPIFYTVEYNLPDFPADTYGFTKQDRLNWANLSINYLLGSVSDDEFSALQFADGTPLFNDLEISHMVDVRDLTVGMLLIWRILVAIFLIAIYLGWKYKWLRAITFALGNGAKITFAIILTILIFVWLDFNQLFTVFHQIFFEGDSWLFYLSDSLIRLFPIKFWQDLFIFIGGFCVLVSSLLLFLSKKYGNKVKAQK